MTLRHKNAGTHRHPAVTPTRAMGIDLASVANRFECHLRTALQLLDWNGKEGTVNGSQRQKDEGLSIRICLWKMTKPHIDHELHAKLAQLIVILDERRGADEQVIGDA